MAAGFLPLLDIRMAWGAGLRAGVRRVLPPKALGIPDLLPRQRSGQREISDPHPHGLPELHGLHNARSFFEEDQLIRRDIPNYFRLSIRPSHFDEIGLHGFA